MTYSVSKCISLSDYLLFLRKGVVRNCQNPRKIFSIYALSPIKYIARGLIGLFLVSMIN